MISLLRRKRPTTAPSTPPAKIFDGCWRRFGAIALVASTGWLSAHLAIASEGAAPGNLAFGSKAPAEQASETATKLKWQPYRPGKLAAERSLAEAQETITESKEKSANKHSEVKHADVKRSDVKHAVASVVKRSKSAQSKGRSQILQVSGRQSDDAELDPFNDEELEDPRGSTKKSTAPSHSAPSGDDEPEELPTTPTFRKPTPAAPRPMPKMDYAPSDNDSFSGPDSERYSAGNGPAPSFAADENCDRFQQLCELARGIVKKTEINTIDINIAVSGNASDDFPCECTLGNETFQPRSWSEICYNWKATGLCHKPVYFEEVALEKYGHSANPLLQPFVSGAHFFLTVPILPYKMGMTPPNECMYTLGYYRPGSCAPYLLNPIPISLRGGLWEAGAWTGLAFIIP